MNIIFLYFVFFVFITHHSMNRPQVLTGPPLTSVHWCWSYHTPPPFWLVHEAIIGKYHLTRNSPHQTVTSVYTRGRVLSWTLDTETARDHQKSKSQLILLLLCIPLFLCILLLLFNNFQWNKILLFLGAWPGAKVHWNQSQGHC